MFRKNDDHLQQPLFSDLDALPPKLKTRLENSWAGTFYQEIFVRLDERPFAELYADTASRPNIPVNVLVGLEILKAGFGWSDEEMYEQFCFNLQVRYALGYRQLNTGQFELRTMYNFRRRLREHQEQTGQELLSQAFEQITDEQVVALEVQTGQLRMDSSQVSSNIRQVSRLQMLVTVLQRLQRDLRQTDQALYEAELGPYLKGSPGQYVYHLKPGSYEQHLNQIGQLMYRLVTELASTYADEASYQMLVRVFQEHFRVEEAEDDDPDGGQVQPYQGSELQAASLQSVDDPEATYRCKAGVGYRGYVVNLTETCHPDNEVQLITNIQTEPNVTDDATLLAEALPDLKARTEVTELYTDGGYNSPETVDPVLKEQEVELVQTAIRGRQPDPAKLNLADYQWELDPDGHPQRLTAPNGQQAEVEPGQAPNRFIARFTEPPQPVTPSAKPPPPAVLYFSQAQFELALRRQRTAQQRASGHNPRAAVEATIGAIKRPFANDKLPVRGRYRVHTMLLGSGLMVNLRRIHRSQTAQRSSETGQTGPTNSAGSLFFEPILRHLRSFFSLFSFDFSRSPVHL